MTMIAPTLQAFFTDRLMQQRNVSPHTVVAYRRTFCLLLSFMHERSGKAPSRLDFADLGAPVVVAFLQYLETDRGNTIRTRNARLSALHSFFRFASTRHPEHAADIERVLSIPQKRFPRAEITHLDRQEIASLLASPDRSTWHGRRDHALLLVAIQTGLRLNELTSLKVGDVHLGVGAHVRCLGKGRKRRSTPMSAQTVAVLKVWMREQAGKPTDPLFPTRRGTALSSDAVERLVGEHTRAAAQRCPSLGAKTVTPHVLRHTNAMQLLLGGVDNTSIALWLGHARVQTTDIYLHADMSLKERALARLLPPAAKPGRYRAPDALMRFLAGP